MTRIERSELCRGLLGTATKLFIDDRDPFSVHALACTAGEHAAQLAKCNYNRTFSEIAALVNGKRLQEIRKIRNHYWNRIKHSSDQSGALFDLNSELQDFSDEVNDHSLFVSWLDYTAGGFPLPIEVQVFQIWYLEKYPEKVDPAYVEEYGRTQLFVGLPQCHKRAKAPTSDANWRVPNKPRPNGESENGS